MSCLFSSLPPGSLGPGCPPTSRAGKLRLQGDRWDPRARQGVGVWWALCRGGGGTDGWCMDGRAPTGCTHALHLFCLNFRVQLISLSLPLYLVARAIPLVCISVNFSHSCALPDNGYKYPLCFLGTLHGSNPPPSEGENSVSGRTHAGPGWKSSAGRGTACSGTWRAAWALLGCRAGSGWGRGCRGLVWGAGCFPLLLRHTEESLRPRRGFLRRLPGGAGPGMRAQRALVRS